MKVYEERFILKYSEKTPAEIVDAEGRKALAVVAQIRDESRKEDLKLKAALAFVDRYIPAKSGADNSALVAVNIIVRGVDV